MLTRGYINLDYLRTLGLPVEQIEPQRPFAPGQDVIVYLDLVSVGCWPSTIWAVSLESGEDERVGIVRRPAVTPLERLEAWQTFGVRGRDVMAILDRLSTLEIDDIDAIEAATASDASLAERVPRRVIDPSAVDYVTTMVAVAVDYVTSRRADQIDPASRDDDDGYLPPHRTWVRAVWRTIEYIAFDAAVALVASSSSARITGATERLARLLDHGTKPVVLGRGRSDVVSNPD